MIHLSRYKFASAAPEEMGIYGIEPGNTLYCARTSEGGLPPETVELEQLISSNQYNCIGIMLVGKTVETA